MLLPAASRVSRLAQITRVSPTQPSVSKNAMRLPAAPMAAGLPWNERGMISQRSCPTAARVLHDRSQKCLCRWRLGIRDAVEQDQGQLDATKNTSRIPCQTISRRDAVESTKRYFCTSYAMYLIKVQAQACSVRGVDSIMSSSCSNDCHSGASHASYPAACPARSIDVTIWAVPCLTTCKPHGCLHSTDGYSSVSRYILKVTWRA